MNHEPNVLLVCCQMDHCQVTYIDQPLSPLAIECLVGKVSLNSNKNLFNYIPKNNYDQYWERMGQRLDRSYASASDNPQDVVMPLYVAVWALLNMRIVWIPWYFYQCTLFQSSNSSLLLKTGTKMPHLVPKLGTHPIWDNVQLQMDSLLSLTIWVSYSGDLQCTLHSFLLLIAQTQMNSWTDPDAITQLHALKHCAQDKHWCWKAQNISN